jgi:hypothetical protein
MIRPHPEVVSEFLDKPIGNLRTGGSLVQAMHERADEAVVLVLRLRYVVYAERVPGK